MLKRREFCRKRDVLGVTLSLGLVLGAYPVLTGMYIRNIFQSLKSLPRADFSKLPAIEYHPRDISPAEDGKISFVAIVLIPKNEKISRRRVV